MKKLLLISASALILVGCGTVYTKTPNITATGGTNGYTYSVSENTSNLLQRANEIVRSVPSVGPEVELGKGAALIGLGLLSGVLSLVARAKSTQAANANGAADILAATVVKSGQQNTALQVASGTPHLSSVAQHIDNNTL